MHEKAKIDIFAYASKYIVDLLPIEQVEKDHTKNSIDATAEILKLIVHTQETKIAHIRAAAQLYNLDRVVAFPCVMQGGTRVLLKMYGGAIPSFCQHLKISLFSKNDIQLRAVYMTQMEQQYGVTLYEKQ